jgi:hypothetical protein
MTTKSSKLVTTTTVTERAEIEKAIKESMLVSETTNDLPATFIVTEISKPLKKIKSPSPQPPPPVQHSEHKKKMVIILKS